MIVYLFGGMLFLSCVNFVLWKIVDDNEGDVDLEMM